MTPLAINWLDTPLLRPKARLSRDELLRQLDEWKSEVEARQ